MAAISVERDEAASARGLEGLLAEAWGEAGRRGKMPAGWRPFDSARSEGIALREDARLAGYAAVRPCEGMDSIDFLYVRRGARRPATFRALIERAVERLKAIGITRIMYAGYGWWREGFPRSFTSAFARAGFGRFDGVFLVQPLAPGGGGGGGPVLAPVAAGYEIGDWRDEWFDEVCDVMLASPEPEALYWDMGLCRRSILNAASPLRPLFPDGFGQIARVAAAGAAAGGDGGAGAAAGPIVGFALSTQHGYVNHVYTHPEHRGRGLARAMLTRLLAALARKAIPRATILTHDTNPGAIALYGRLGFGVDFRYPQFHLSW